MKLTYEYRTSDNVKHVGTIRAADVDDAYAKLKPKGIKPSRVTPVPGFFNRFTLRQKLWALCLALAALCLVLAYFALPARTTTTEARGTRHEARTPSPAYLAFERESDAIVERGTNDVERARAELQALVRARYSQFAEGAEREAVERLYGRQMILLDQLAAIRRLDDLEKKSPIRP